MGVLGKFTGRISRSPHHEQKSNRLLEELNNPELSINFTVTMWPGGLIYGNAPMPIDASHYYSEDSKAGDVKFSFDYIAPARRRNPGTVVLSLVIFEEGKSYYRHSIHWPSRAGKDKLPENIVEAVFEEIYRKAYGESLQWLIRKEVLLGTYEHCMEKGDRLTRFDVYDIFNFNKLFFKDNQDTLRRLIVKAIERPERTNSASETEEGFRLPSEKMSFGMRRIYLSRRSSEELQSAFLDNPSVLSLEDIRFLFDTKEKIQALDLRVFPPEVVITLLAQDRLWRESIEPQQLRQIDLSGQKDIQYLFVPTLKYFTRDPGSTVINMDTISDAQLSMHRDTFLRDVFLAGDFDLPAGILHLRVQTPWEEASRFKIDRRAEVAILGLDVVMERSLPKGMHDFIVKQLGFSKDFESMTAEQRRELFKKEIEMLNDNRKQLAIIKALVRENEVGQHNWFLNRETVLIIQSTPNR